MKLSSAAGCAQMVARSKEDILAARGVKPMLSPNLNTLATVEALGVKRLLFIGVGCQARFCPCCAFVMLSDTHLAHGCQASAAAALTRDGQMTWQPCAWSLTVHAWAKYEAFITPLRLFAHVQDV